MGSETTTPHKEPGLGDRAEARRTIERGRPHLSEIQVSRRRCEDRPVWAPRRGSSVKPSTPRPLTRRSRFVRCWFREWACCFRTSAVVGIAGGYSCIACRGLGVAHCMHDWNVVLWREDCTRATLNCCGAAAHLTVALSSAQQ